MPEEKDVEIDTPQDFNSNKNVMLKPKVKQLGGIRKFPNGIQATNWRFGQKVYEDEAFSFRKLEINIKSNGEDYPAFTMGQYIIQGNSKIEWTTYNKDALYYVRSGEGWFMIDEDGKTLETGYMVGIPSETRHCILNQSKNIPCIVDLTFPGKIMLDDD